MYTRSTYPFTYPLGYKGETKPGPWPAKDVIALMCQPGFFEPDDGRAVIACQVWLGESSLMPVIQGPIIWSPDNSVHLAQAYGMFQLLDIYFRKGTTTPAFPDTVTMTPAELYDPHFAWVEVWKILHKGGAGFTYTPGQFNLNFNWWSAYMKGTYMTKERREIARIANEEYLEGLDA